MTDDQLVKVIQKAVKDEVKQAVKDEVRPLKEQVEIVKSRITKLDLFQNVATETIRTIKEQQSVINEKLDFLREELQEMKETQDNSIYPSVVETEKNIKAYGDMYKLNNDNARKLEKRVNTLEKVEGIEPAEELLLVEVT